MKAITLKIFAGLVVSFMATMSSASDFLAISDFSQIKWQMRSDGKVYFRNINEFDSSYLGCCYNYHIDPATEPGKAMFSAFLALHMAAKPGNIGVPDKSQASALNYIGRW